MVEDSAHTLYKQISLVLSALMTDEQLIADS